VKSILPRALLYSLLSMLLACCNSSRSTSATSASTPKPQRQESPAPFIAEFPRDQTNLIGMNVDFAGDFVTTRLFADAIKQSRVWQKIGSDQPAKVDTKGWPLEDVHLPVWQGIGRMDGTYRLSFNGQAEVRISCCAGSLQNQTYNAATNTTTADLVYPSKGAEGLFLLFQKTKRSPSGQPNSGIANVKLMRPIAEGGTQTYSPSTLFTTPFKTTLKRFKVLRFMDFLATNGNAQKHWSERLPKDWYSMNQSAPGYGWQGRGGAYEYAIALCNELNTDCWLNVPTQADDDYVRQLAKLIKSQLAPNLKVYIEYSNELWNTSGGFAQSQQNHDLAKTEVAQGKSPLNFDGDANDWYWAWRRVAKRSVDISLIFRQTFGDAAMMTRVRPVMMTQLTYADGPLFQAMHLMQDYYNNPAKVSAPKPPRYYLYGIGGSGYYNPKETSSPDAVFADLTDRAKWTAALQQDANYAAAFGLKRIAYEAGPAFEGGSFNDKNRSTYRDDPRMKTGMIQAHDLWSSQGGDLIMYFTIVGESPWGFVPDIWDAENSKKNLKLQAIDALRMRPRAKVTYGTLLPATLEASKYSLPPKSVGQDSSQIKPGQWFSYTVRTERPGQFKLKLQASATEASEVEIWVNGARLGVLAVPKQGLLEGDSVTQTLTVPLQEGLQGIMLRGKIGTAKVSRIIVTQ
jgi:hypothetical protein